LRIYINGEFDKEAPPGLKWGNEPKTLNTLLGIGKIGALWNGNEDEESFSFGVIDEVNVYNRTLSAEEAKQNYDTDTQATAVESAGKVALTWGGIKRSRCNQILNLDSNLPSNTFSKPVLEKEICTTIC